MREVAERIRAATDGIGQALLITDMNVERHYGTSVQETLEEGGWNVGKLVLPAGESTKSRDKLGEIYDRALDWGIDREALVVALGGGVIGDLAGFAAATLLRGLPLVHLPTTLVAQVDSSIGGKTGINHRAGKNLIGSFYQPLLVCTDPSALQTLPDREWYSGLAEVVKHALIQSPELMRMLQSNWTSIADRSFEDLPAMLRLAAGVKTAIVSEDEREHGKRAWLNFGHTVGHAVEKVVGYGKVSHGEGVALGMECALHLSKGFTANLEITAMLQMVQKLPIRTSPEGISFDALYEAMRFDKKNRRGNRRFVLLRAPGEPYVSDAVDKDQLQRAWDRVVRARS